MFPFYVPLPFYDMHNSSSRKKPKSLFFQTYDGVHFISYKEISSSINTPPLAVGSLQIKYQIQSLIFKQTVECSTYHIKKLLNQWALDLVKFYKKKINNFQTNHEVQILPYKEISKQKETGEMSSSLLNKK